jgi:hypothetical protein
MVVWSGVVMGVAFEILLPIIITVNVKAFVEVLADSLVIELLLSREDMKKSLTLFRFD